VQDFQQLETHARNEVIGRLNPNRRHDDPIEKEHDNIRAEINASHRFDSFAAERTNNFVKWHVDGHDYMWAVSEMLDRAQDVIFIMDWWLTPELFLRRPPAYHPEWRLDRVLKRKADAGVKVYVIVYKEVTQTMSMSSKHTKRVLDSLGPNVACMRHPDHIGTKDNVEFWSHHEKVVVVDNHYAAIGGLDLCFGRWDTHTHPLADVHPTEFAQTLFPGQDYNNARIMDFRDVYNYASNTLSMLESARMPWHDTHMTLAGPAVLDIVQHFTERWNEIKKRKYKDDTRYDWLALPHDVAAAPGEAVARHPHREMWHAIGRRYKQRFHLGDTPREAGDAEDGYRVRGAGYGCHVQVVRSVSDWSNGVLTECSIQNAYRQMIQEAHHFIYIENQFFISATKEGGPVKNLIAQALVERILRAARGGVEFKVIVVIPEVPGFAGDIKTVGSIKTIMGAQYRTINRGGSSIYEEIRKAGFEPMDYIRFYHLRSYDRINAPYGSFIARMERNSGVTFSEAQVALARQWIGVGDADTQTDVTIAVVQPERAPDGAVGEGGVKTENVRIPATAEEARSIIARFEAGADGVRGDEAVADNVAQHMLGDSTGLQAEGWLGTEEEERDAYVSELLYIHTKLMIVDDRRVIMGSANLNDRSQKGSGDSEIALVVEDNDLVEATMDGRPHMAARFATTLRRQLFREHLGLIPPQDCAAAAEPVTSFMRAAPHANASDLGTPPDSAVADPLAPATLSLWESTARRNREIFTEVFRPVPTNLVRDWPAYDRYVPRGVKTGHVAPGVPLARVKQLLSQVRGALVQCPLDFLADDKDLVEGPQWSGLDPLLPVYI
jgi:phospholipase D1/2